VVVDVVLVVFVGVVEGVVLGVVIIVVVGGLGVVGDTDDAVVHGCVVVPGVVCGAEVVA